MTEHGQNLLSLGGMSRYSSVDWPGQLVATLFCQGCPWRCPYCHNPDLLPPGQGTIAWEKIIAFLQSRRGLLDGVVISGGEPLLQASLAGALHEIRAMGFATGLHTGGVYPGRFAKVLPLLDWVGFDVKAPYALYDRITGAPGSAPRARESLLLLRDSGVKFDLRTTIHPALLTGQDIDTLDQEMAGLDLPPVRRQLFRAAGCADPELVKASLVT